MNLAVLFACAYPSAYVLSFSFSSCQIRPALLMLRQADMCAGLSVCVYVSVAVLFTAAAAFLLIFMQSVGMRVGKETQ